MRAGRSIAVIIGGGPLARVARTHDMVIAADSGYDAALAAGFTPTHLVGDLDSISAAGRNHAEHHGVTIHRHSPDKDDTDTALAIALAVKLEADDLTLIGPVDTGRLDHLLGSLAVLGDPALSACASVTAHTAGATLHVVHPGRSLHLPLGPGTTFSLLALHGDCAGVDLAGSAWELSAARLSASGSLGVSNVALGAITVGTRVGVLTLVIAQMDAGEPRS